MAIRIGSAATRRRFLATSGAATALATTAKLLLENLPGRRA